MADGEHACKCGTRAEPTSVKASQLDVRPGIPANLRSREADFFCRAKGTVDASLHVLLPKRGRESSHVGGAPSEGLQLEDPADHGSLAVRREGPLSEDSLDHAAEEVCELRCLVGERGRGDILGKFFMGGGPVGEPWEPRLSYGVPDTGLVLRSPHTGKGPQHVKTRAG